MNLVEHYIGMSFLCKKLSENLTGMQSEVSGGSNLDKDLVLYQKRSKEFMYSYAQKFKDGRDMIVPNPTKFWSGQVCNLIIIKYFV